MINSLGRVILTVSIVTAIGVGSFYGYSGRKHRSLEESTENRSADARIDETDFRELDGDAHEDGRAAANVLMPDKNSFSFDRISNISELIEKLSHSTTDEGQQTEYFRQVALFCEGAKLNEASKNSSKAIQKKQSADGEVSSAYVKKYASKFCNRPIDSFLGKL